MALVLVATQSGFRTFTDAGETKMELGGRQIGAVSSEVGGSCLAVVDGREIWRRDAEATWSKVATSPICLQSLTSVGGVVFGGATDKAAMVRITPTGEVERLKGFDQISGRSEWFAGGPPLGVRALTRTSDGAVILAAVHVGGVPRSADRGETWAPTIPIAFDVHEVRAHPALPNLIAAATAVGVCLSQDSGQTWKVLSEGLEIKNSLAVAVLQDEVLFGVSDGPFAKRSQVWRWRIGGAGLEPVRDGLPQWLEGKIDTAWLAVGEGRAAILDGGGNLWRSRIGSTGWEPIAAGLPYSSGLLIL
jgi:hypothetical protein